MQPGDFRRFERPRRGVEGANPPGPVLPEEGAAVVLDRHFPCPCTQCESDCGGTVALTAVLWVDNWPVARPETPAGEVVTEIDLDAPVRSFHLSIAPSGLEKQTACSKGCEISPADWTLGEAFAFLALARSYTDRGDALRAALLGAAT